MYCVILFLFPILTIKKQPSFWKEKYKVWWVFQEENQVQFIHSIIACHVTAEPWHHQQQTNVPKTARCIREIKHSFPHAKAPTWTDEEKAWLLLEEGGCWEGNRDNATLSCNWECWSLSRPLRQGSCNVSFDIGTWNQVIFLIRLLKCHLDMLRNLQHKDEFQCFQRKVL